MEELNITLKKHFPSFDTNLLNEIIEFSQILEIPKKTQILSKGDYVRILPVVLSGTV
jgi:hypothetical protein